MSILFNKNISFIKIVSKIIDETIFILNESKFYKQNNLIGIPLNPINNMILSEFRSSSVYKSIKLVIFHDDNEKKSIKDIRYNINCFLNIIETMKMWKTKHIILISDENSYLTKILNTYKDDLNIYICNNDHDILLAVSRCI